MIASKRELRIEIAHRVGSGILLGEFVERAFVSSELVRRDAKHEALDGEVRREVLGIPVENASGGFSDAVQGLVVIDDLLARHIAQGLGGGDNGFGEV